MLRVPFFGQQKEYTCGPASLGMVFGFFGLRTSETSLARLAKTTREGTSHLHLIDAARKKGFYCFVHEAATVNQIKHFVDIGEPVIVNYVEPSTEEGHYAVIVGYTKHSLIFNDPWNGKRFKMSVKEFIRRWHDCHEGHKYRRWILVLSKNKFELGKQYYPA